MNIDDETMKQIGSSATSTVTVGILGAIWLWFSKVITLPKRVARIEQREAVSHRLQLAQVDFSLAISPKGKAEARESLRSARDEMYNSLTSGKETKQ